MKQRGLLVADSTIDPLSGYLTNAAGEGTLEPVVASFDQVVQILLDGSLEWWTPPPDFLVVWTRPERVAPAFQRARRFESVDLGDVLAEVDAFATLLLRARERVRLLLVPSWVLPPLERGLGMLDRRPGVGIADLLARMNLRLAERLQTTSDTYVLDAARWVAAAGRTAFNPKLWYTTKSAFGLDVFREAAQDIAAAIHAAKGGTAKLVILDLDDTLWGGPVGDLGWQEVRLGGHDPAGEAFVDFQLALQALKNRGVLLAIASKNDEQVALEALDRHPEMVLRREDFAAWRIHWGDKAESIAAIARELNLGLQSVLFVDDNPVERARVREALPEVLVPEWPADPMLYRSALQALRCFDTAIVTAEDAARAGAYTAERERNNLRTQVGSIDEWLETLGTQVTIEPWQERNAPRTAQLLNKTNQMNLRTRRLTEGELRTWLASGNAHLWTVRVADRFGDAGLTGILGLTITDGCVEITDFVLSCRVMGRRIEETLLHAAVSFARARGIPSLRARYTPTAKNAPCLRFFEQSGLAQDGDVFTWNTATPYPAPRHVTIACGDSELPLAVRRAS